jgi:hypothetical protein
VALQLARSLQCNTCARTRCCTEPQVRNMYASLSMSTRMHAWNLASAADGKSSKVWPNLGLAGNQLSALTGQSQCDVCAEVVCWAWFETPKHQTWNVPTLNPVECGIPLQLGRVEGRVPSAGTSTIICNVSTCPRHAFLATNLTCADEDSASGSIAVSS